MVYARRSIEKINVAVDCGTCRCETHKESGIYDLKNINDFFDLKAVLIAKGIGKISVFINIYYNKKKNSDF